MHSGREGSLNIRDLLKFELAPIPPSIFKDSGALRTATSKCKLKSTLSTPRSSQQKVDIVIVDASAQLWVTGWPSKGGLASDLINTFREFIVRELGFKQDVYIVFDRYQTESIKGHTRAVISSKWCYTQIPPSDVNRTASTKDCSYCAQNKMQLTDLIVKSLRENPIVSKQKLVVTGLDDTPLHIQEGVVTELATLKTSHEEADVIMINQLLWAVTTNSTKKSVKVICDDTDVFALLVHYVHTEKIENHILMQSTKSGHQIIDIHEAIETMVSKQVDPGLILQVHALSGCDTVAAYHRVGKSTALKVAKKFADSLNLTIIGDLTQSEDDVYKAASHFVSRCYGCLPQDDISDVRCKVWFKKTAASLHANPKLESLPPTEAALRPNILRAHYQTAIWRSCANQDPPMASPANFGWYRTDRGQMLPKMFSEDVNIAPEEILKLIRCQCHSVTNRCGGRCTCKDANLQCTSFCGCNDDGTFCCRYQDIADQSPDAYENLDNEIDNHSDSEDDTHDTDV